ncbi:hypothetical protein N0V84_004269 [Fusarium piperis]|uniref:Epoxide hydrolase N-terminal domain-containing protein n=1 Tax=Fusarium piperis TaxID=1435070 RepID=A0A9W8WFR5_9HYPO|nr:hypothetical protein N0V84_004269 [Fusarium piperis]
MIELVRNSRLPDKPEYPGVGSSMGIDLDVLKSLKKQWLSDFNWKTEQDNLNKLHHYVATIEGLDIHFVHHKSNDPNAIPLLLNHGWPGSFLEFIPIIDPLTKKAKTSTGKTVSFDVIIPSLPGYAFSSPPPEGWTSEDTARIFNTLMTEILGYKKFAVHGTDLGAPVAYHLYDAFNTTTRAAHFVFLPYYPLTPDELMARNITLSPEEEFAEQNFPNTIGLALYDNPIGQLAWIGEKFVNWSDPSAGTSPSVLDHDEILRSVSLYYLTKSFISSVYMYAQNPMGFLAEYRKARTDAPMLFSTFKYNVGFWPKELVEEAGNLVQYRFHDFGGHFPGVDNPPALVEDLREIGTYWQG